MNMIMPMLRNLSSIEFVFENGDGVLVESENFIMFGIKEDTVRFAIDGDYNRKYYDDYAGWNILFDRLMENDIAQIIVRDKGFDRYTIYIDWQGIDGDTNTNQNTYINEFGNLVCEVKYEQE